ncbi:hypothetical protein [Paenibacillus tundrae]|uniref:Uncharacterized protein n=1 Tax=Paenibacillus tundrae TaxID=528187 RepID=A0ABT9W7B4_9BACL|nr:hypothetical protein [Paenibacillus tundrae]MDQ0168735.1 hypothetical protein [Paenibacillus tundrae]
MSINGDFLGFAAMILAGGISLSLCVHGFNVVTIHKHYHRKDDAN